MTPLRKLSWLYASTLLMACVVIMSVLRLGSALPPPEGATAVASKTIETTATAESALSGLTRTLKANLDNPLGHLLMQLFGVIALAGLAGRVCKRIGQPPVVGEIVVGILLGPSLFGLLSPWAFAFVFPSDSLGTLRVLSQIGACLFMFTVGTELDVRMVKRSSYVSIAVSHVSIAFPYLLGVLLAYFLYNDRMTPEQPSHGTLAISVCVALAASLTTEVIGIHALFGAFLAGTMMPDVYGFRRRIGEQIGTFSSVLLLPLFFVFTGLRTQIGLLHDLAGWSLCLLITAIATLGKLGGTTAAARLTGMSWFESLQLGALMNTRGLMELIALNIGYDLGILSPRIFTMLVIMAVLTTMMTGPLLALFGTEKYGIADDMPEPSST